MRRMWRAAANASYEEPEVLHPLPSVKGISRCVMVIRVRRNTGLHSDQSMKHNFLYYVSHLPHSYVAVLVNRAMLSCLETQVCLTLTMHLSRIAACPGRWAMSCSLQGLKKAPMLAQACLYPWLSTSRS